MTRPYRILVTGSRGWTDRYTVEVVIRRAVLRSGNTEAVVVHGNADGADACADVSARAMGLTVERHPVAREDWSAPCREDCLHGGRRRRGDGTEYCPAAGNRRNRRMVDLGADVCLAFPMPDSRGTWDCVRRARAAGIPVVLDLRHAGPCPDCYHDGPVHDGDGRCTVQVPESWAGPEMLDMPCDCGGFGPRRRRPTPIIEQSPRTETGAVVVPGGVRTIGRGQRHIPEMGTVGRVVDVHLPEPEEGQ